VPPFEQIYAKHFNFVWAMVRHYGVHPDYVADAVQDVFVVVHTKLHTLLQPESARSWLHGIVRRVASGYRRKRHNLIVDVPLEPLPDANTSLTPAEQAERNEKLLRLSALLGAIEPSKRKVFVMCELEEFTCPEIAEMLELPLNTVYSRLRRARAAFEKALARYPEFSGKAAALAWREEHKSLSFEAQRAFK
jgi:RNA polymerase sigma-70 factor (ECF subfamily)